MSYKNKFNFKDATKDKKAAKHWSKLDLIFKINAPNSSTNGKQTKLKPLRIFQDITFILITLKVWQAESNTLQ